MAVPKDSELRLPETANGIKVDLSRPTDFEITYFPYEKGPLQIEYSVVSDSALYRTVSGTSPECIDVSYSLAETSLYCTIIESGTVIVRNGAHVRLLTPGHVAVAIGPMTTQARLSRGKHLWHTFVVDKADMRGAMTDPETVKRLTESFGVYLVSIQKIERTFGLTSFMQLHREAATKGQAASGAIAAMILATEPEKERTPLANSDMKVGSVFDELMKEVFESPEKPWTLAHASALVGYSPFHFSRTFRAAVGYGFPEFVDRCRAQCVMFDLIETDTPVDRLAADYGYGSSTTLRQALKEYTGFLPSEFRLSSMN